MVLRVLTVPQVLKVLVPMVLMVPIVPMVLVAQTTTTAQQPAMPLRTFTPEEICQIVALSCENPDALNIPISHWSQSELARQAAGRGIVKSISHGSIGRFFKRSRYQAASQPLLADAKARSRLR